jgi:hypothetical protein
LPAMDQREAILPMPRCAARQARRIESLRADPSTPLADLLRSE